MAAPGTRAAHATGHVEGGVSTQLLLAALQLCTVLTLVASPPRTGVGALPACLGELPGTVQCHPASMVNAGLHMQGIPSSKGAELR